MIGQRVSQRLQFWTKVECSSFLGQNWYIGHMLATVAQSAEERHEPMCARFFTGLKCQKHLKKVQNTRYPTQDSQRVSQRRQFWTKVECSSFGGQNCYIQRQKWVFSSYFCSKFASKCSNNASQAYQKFSKRIETYCEVPRTHWKMMWSDISAILTEKTLIVT